MLRFAFVRRLQTLERQWRSSRFRAMLSGVSCRVTAHRFALELSLMLGAVKDAAPPVATKLQEAIQARLAPCDPVALRARLP